MTEPAVAMGWDRIRVAIPRVVEAGFALFVVIVLGAVMTFKSDVFLTTGNLQNILLQTSFLACAAFGMTLVIIAAELDLSQGPCWPSSGWWRPRPWCETTASCSAC